jgi:hypothetical protein
MREPVNPGNVAQIRVKQAFAALIERISMACSACLFTLDRVI